MGGGRGRRIGGEAVSQDYSGAGWAGWPMELFLCFGCNRSTGCLLLRTSPRLRFRKRGVKGILRGFKLSVAGLQETITCTRNREKGGLDLFLLPSWGKVFACSKWTEDVNKEDLHHARYCRGTREIKQAPHCVHLCSSVFRKLETGEVLYIQCYRHFPISVAISRQWRGDLQSALMTWG